MDRILMIIFDAIVNPFVQIVRHLSSEKKISSSVLGVISINYLCVEC